MPPPKVSNFLSPSSAILCVDRHPSNWIVLQHLSPPPHPVFTETWELICKCANITLCFRTEQGGERELGSASLGVARATTVTLACEYKLSGRKATGLFRKLQLRLDGAALLRCFSVSFLGFYIYI